METGVVTEIKDLALKTAITVLDKDGKMYTAVKMNRLYDDPRPAALQIQSLTGILDYLESNVDNWNLEKFMIHIVDHETVNLITNICGESNKRNTVLTAKREGKDFPFEQWIEQEKFIIFVRSLFMETNDRADILFQTSKISTDSAIKTGDDGVKQNIQIKKGISGAVLEAAEIKPIVKLKPCRTFPEIDQPESEFLFRMKESNGSVHCALFEADNAAWKNTARMNIKEFLEPSGVVIIA